MGVHGAHLFDERLGVLERVGDSLEHLLVVAAIGHLLGDVPHGQEALVEGAALPVAIDHQEPVLGGLDGGPQERHAVRQLDPRR